MKDIGEARKVEEALRSTTAPPLPAHGLTQPDHDLDRTRALHYLSEVNRLCALLQLYETFPDLSYKTQTDIDGPDMWHSWVIQLVLHAVDLLGKVPPGSMSCLQPLLCLCVGGGGLRRESQAPMGGWQHEFVRDTDLNATGIPSYLLSSNDVSENTTKVLQARQAVMARLDQFLEVSLARKPIEVAKQLQRAVWSAYDDETGLTRRTHWLDVMSSTGLYSIFR